MASQRNQGAADADAILALGGLPHGWTASPFNPGYVLITSPDCLMVTIDVKLRALRDGGVTTGPYTSARALGRGWRKALLDAAVRRLKEAAVGWVPAQIKENAHG